MSASYKKKILISLRNTPNPIQNDHKSSLTKHTFDLELYVPKTISTTVKLINNSTTNIPKRNYLRDRLVNFDSKMHEDKEYLDHIKKETDHFTTQYSIFRKEENSNVSNRLSKTYDTAIEQYRKRGYNEDKLLPKKNIFEQSVLLANNKNLEIIIENEERKQLIKDQKMLSKFSVDVTRTIKGETNKLLSKKNSTFEVIQELPYINKTHKAIKKENRTLKNDIYLTERSIHDYFDSIIPMNETYSNTITDNTTDTNYSAFIDKHRNSNLNPDSQRQQQQNDELQHKKAINNEISVKNNTRKSLLKEKIILNKNVNNPNVNSHNKKEQRMRYKIEKNFKNIVDSPLRQVELKSLYNNSQKGNQENNVKLIKVYLQKNKKKIIEPIM